MVDKERFFKAKDKVIGIDRQRHGIGTLSEKTVHAVIKNYYEPDEDKQEIPIENYVADIYNEKGIIEIQNGNFNKIRDKLECFLKEYDVTIVYPIPRNKYLIWVDELTGEYSPKRKSPQKGNPYIAFPELYKIKNYLKDEKLHFRFVLIDVEEIRLLNKNEKVAKRRSRRYDRLPIDIGDEICIDRVEDYMQLVPYDLLDEFTVEDFSKAAHINRGVAQVAVNILYYVGVIDRVGKRGRSYLYKVDD